MDGHGNLEPDKAVLANTTADCQKKCKETDGCLSFAFNQNKEEMDDGYGGCWLKNKKISELDREAKVNVTLVPKFCSGNQNHNFRDIILEFYFNYFQCQNILFDCKIERQRK